MDKREQIIARLVTVAGTVPGVKVERNRQSLSDIKTPTIVIYDADENASPGDPGSPRPVNAPRRVTMEPQIWIVVGDSVEDVGTTLNGFRAAVIKAVIEDATLAGFTFDRDGIRYEGSASSFAMGRNMVGQMFVHFSFTYLLKTSDL